MKVLELQNLSITTEWAPLLRNISFTVDEGEVLAIIGPNGAGKTSLLNAISQTLPFRHHKEGQLLLRGQAVGDIPAALMAKQLAVLPQLSALQFPFTAQEVVELGRMPHSSGYAVDKSIVTEALKTLDIFYLRDQLYTALSGGEKQRVHLARVMTQIWHREDAASRLLLLDEPTSSLDIGHQHQLLKAIRSFADEGVAIIINAHDINLVANHADHILALGCGEVIAQGTPEQVVTGATIKQLYNIDVEVVNHPRTGKPMVIPDS